ncbi:hypothetical protein TNCV_1764961 [Trichonephila clavipes]|nr:hypothetical protein TNCV_1764961 [Trichonephila clavipes]
MLVRVSEDQALYMERVYELFARFREGRESVSDNPLSGRLVISVSDENIEKARTPTADPPIIIGSVYWIFADLREAGVGLIGGV